MSDTHAAVGETETQDKTVLATATDQTKMSTEQVDGKLRSPAEDANQNARHLRKRLTLKRLLRKMMPSKVEPLN
jgi:hypothetical protein